MSSVYIVASFPRTGTTTLCEMASMVGLKPKHQSFEDFPKDLENGFNFFADTPFYDLGLLTGYFQHHKNIKVIYSMRDLRDIKASWDRWGITNYLKQFRIITAANICEIVTTICIRRLQVDALSIDHYISVKKLCEHYNVPFFEYNFGMGWEPFCKFTRTIPPEEPIPHLNKSKS